MAKASEVAKYILYTAYKFGDSITNLKLQKLLYYIQVDYLVKHNGMPLFAENIEAWQYGPVVREVYNLYKCFGRNPINDEGLSEQFELSTEEKKSIEDSLEKYMSYSAYELVSNIHQEQPWIDSYEEGKDNIIPNESMYNFYKSLVLKREELLAEIEDC